VSWLSRIGRGVPREAKSEAAQGEVGLPRVERSAPGIASLFSNLDEDGSHAVLDLGPASESSFRIYSRFARRIRFAGILEAPSRGETWTAALRLLPDKVDTPFDLVLAWNLLDRVPPELRSPVVERLARITVRGARLYVLVDASGESICYPLRFTLPGLDMVSHQIIGEPYPAGSRLLPAEVKRLLEPFQVVQAFTLKDGFREYLGVRS
jgi:hypothetical protein